MTFDPIFRDIWSQLEFVVKDINNTNLTYLDIVRAFNDSVAKLRVDYINKGLGQSFSVTQTALSATTDTTYPFTNSCELTYEVLKSVHPSRAILNIVVYKDYEYDEEYLLTEDGETILDEGNVQIIDSINTAVTVPDAPGSYVAGSNGIFGSELYVAVDDIFEINSYRLRFKPKDVRKFSASNGLTYKLNDVIYDGTNYYRCLSTFKNTDSVVFTANTQKLYWKYVGDAHYRINVYNFDRINALKVVGEFDSEYAVTFNGKRLYTSPTINKFTITYIPEIIEVANMTDVVNIPDFLLPIVKDETIKRIERKMGVNVVDDRYKYANPETKPVARES